MYGKQELLRDVWGYRSVGATQNAGRARVPPAEKLRSSSRRWVLNVRGVGYRLTDAP